MTVVAADVIEWLGADDDTVDAELLDRVLAAALGTLSDGYDLALAIVDDEDRHDQAVVMYAARLYRRKYSANGVEAVADWGPIRVSVSDPDVHTLLSKWELIRFG